MSKITGLSLMSEVDGVYLALKAVDGEEKFFRWVETRAFYNKILEGLRMMELNPSMDYRIEFPTTSIELKHGTKISKPQDLPIEVLKEFFNTYIEQEGWTQIDEEGNLI